MQVATAITVCIGLMGATYQFTTKFNAVNNKADRAITGLNHYASSINDINAQLTLLREKCVRVETELSLYKEYNKK